MFAVENDHLVHMHGVVGFDWKEIEPAAFPAPVTSKSTTPANDCTALNQPDRATFQLRYLTAVHGNAPRNAKHVVGSLVRSLQGYDDCHPFDPLPPPPPVGVSCTWRYRWSLTR